MGIGQVIAVKVKSTEQMEALNNLPKGLEELLVWQMLGAAAVALWGAKLSPR